MPNPNPPKGAHVKPEGAGAQPGASTSVEHTESQDSYKSGGQGKEQRGELEKNAQSGQSQKGPDEPAGLHRTGSFTNAAEEPEDPSK